MAFDRYSPAVDCVEANTYNQGLKASESLQKKQEKDYCCIDNLRNATIHDDYIYMSTYDGLHKKVYNGEELGDKGFSGYFTNETTANRFTNADGTFDTYGYHRSLCVKPHEKNGVISDREYLDKFYIDRDRMEQIYGTRDFNAAIGKCSANNHFGPDGGDQGFNPAITELYNNGCLKHVDSWRATPESRYRCSSERKKMDRFSYRKNRGILSGQSPEEIQKIGYPLDKSCHEATAWNATLIEDLQGKYQNHTAQYNENIAAATKNTDRSIFAQNYAPSDAQLPSMKREPNLDALLNAPKATQASLTTAQTNVAASSAAGAAQHAASSLKGGLGV